MITRSILAASALMIISVAHSSDGPGIVTFEAGQVGPYYCPAGQVRSAKIVSGEEDSHLTFGKRVAGTRMTLTGAGGEQACVDLSDSDKEANKEANCIRLREASRSETRIEVVCR
jgi:hypothetical protein